MQPSLLGRGFPRFARFAQSYARKTTCIDCYHRSLGLDQRRCKSAKPAPATQRKRRQERDRYLTHAEMHERSQKDSEFAPRVYGAVIDYFEKLGTRCEHSPERIKQFANDFSREVAKDYGSQTSMSSRTLANLLRESPGLDPGECYPLAVHFLLGSHGVARGLNHVGWRIMFTLSQEGCILATVDILRSWLARTTRQSGVLLDDRIKPELIRLQQYLVTNSSTEVVSETRKFDVADARRLEASILDRLGERDKAITSMEKAWNLMENDGFKNPHQDSGQDLSKAIAARPQPIWIQLFDMYRAAYDRMQTSEGSDWRHAKRCELIEKMQKVVDKGIEHSDAMSHFYAAQLLTLRHPHQPDPKNFQVHQNSTTTAWLQHMTQAAASSVWQAAHELGLYYERCSIEAAQEPAASSFSPQQDSTVRAIAAASTAASPKLSPPSAFALNKAPKASEDMMTATMTKALIKQPLFLAIQWYTAAARRYFAPSLLALTRLKLIDAARQDHSSAILQAKQMADLSEETKALLRDCNGAAVAQHRYVDANRDKSTQQHVDLSGDFRVDKWFMVTSIFDTWGPNTSPYFTDMSKSTTHLCDQYELDIYDEAGALLYSHK